MIGSTIKRMVMHPYVRDYGKVVAILCSFLFIVVLGYLIHETTQRGVLKVTFFDVGQGDAIFIETPSQKQILIDGGATREVIHHLSRHMSHFDRTIDVVVGTHNDADHITGLIPVLERYKVGMYVSSFAEGETSVYQLLQEEVTQEKESGGVHYFGKRGDVIDFGDGVVAKILSPSFTFAQGVESNDASVAILLTYGEHSFLLTGDMTIKVEPYLVAEDVPQSITVYKAGHHGSNTSSGEFLLSRIKPEYVVISAGKENRYGHPHKDTLSRLQKYSQEILSTIDRGSITFISNGRELEVATTK